MRITGYAAVVLLGCGAAVAQAFGRFAYGALLPALRDDLGISNTIAGSIGTVNVGAYLVGTLAVAALTGRLRLLVLLRIGLVLATCGLALMALAPGPEVVTVAMFLSGFGGAVVWIPTPAIAVAAVGVERRSKAVALLGSGIGLGVVITGQLTGWVRTNLGDESWRTAYVVMAIAALVVMLLTTLFIGHGQARPTGGGQIGGFATLRRMPGWLPMTAIYTSFGLMYLLVLAFLATRLEDDSGWTGSEASLAFTFVGLASVFGGPVFVALTDRVGAAPALMTAFTGWAVLALLVLPGWFAPTLFASAGLGLIFSGVPSMITLYVVANTTLEDYGPTFAAATLAFGVAQMISPQLGGAVADVTGSFLLVFLLSAFMAVVGFASAARLPRAAERHQPRP